MLVLNDGGDRSKGSVSSVCLSGNDDSLHPADSLCLREQAWRGVGSLGPCKVPLWKALARLDPHLVGLFSFPASAETLFQHKFASTLTLHTCCDFCACQPLSHHMGQHHFTPALEEVSPTFQVAPRWLMLNA